VLGKITFLFYCSLLPRKSVVIVSHNMQSCDTMYFKLKFWNKLDLDVLQNIMLKNKANQCTYISILIVDKPRRNYLDNLTFRHRQWMT
jgi:hypothetical protein